MVCVIIVNDLYISLHRTVDTDGDRLFRDSSQILDKSTEIHHE